MRRAIAIEGTDVTLELAAATGLKLGKETLFHLDELPNGKWRIIHDTLLVPDLTAVSAITLKNVGGKKLVDASITFEGMGVTLPLSKVHGMEAPEKRIHLEKTKAGAWMLLYSRDLIPDISAVSALRFIRED
jgi:hypothetical protein